MPEATGLDSLKIGGSSIFPNGLDEYTFWLSGAQTTGTLKQQFLVCCPGTIIDVRAYITTAPVGSTFIVDVNINGTTAFTSQAARPTIADGGNASTATLPAVTALAVGDRLSIDVDQIGSGTAGSNLSVTVAVKRTNVA